jgi:outer membrane receptor protein involved in Fe transport
MLMSWPTFLGFTLLSGALASGQTPDPAADSIAELQRMMAVQVQTAALRKQSLQDAPASVTVIAAEDIRRYGYRTLAEVLANVRGFYTISDGALRYAGVRGFSLLGDYNMRFLVLLNGHQLTDNVYSAMYHFGQDFPLDMDLVEQIEIVRGPSSALYGSNGIFATVNVITKTPTNAARERVTAEVGSFGSQKLTASSSFTLGKAVKVLISFSGEHSGGRTVDFPELAQRGFSPSGTAHAEAEIGYHTFANLAWKNWTVTAVFGQYKAIVPTGWYGADIGDTGTSDLESRDFVEAAWSRAAGKRGEVRWRTYYDRYRYDGVYPYAADPAYRNYDGALGDWLGSQFVYQTHRGRLGIVTVGGEGNVDLRNVQYNFNLIETAGGFIRDDKFRISHRRTSGGVFVQDELKLSPAWTAYLGGRIDGTTSDPAFFSPRAVLVYTRHGTTYKLMYGKAFRNPSTFERYWEPNPALKAERISTVEFSREQSLHKRVNLIASVFRYGLTNLIEGVPISVDTLQYRNAWRASAVGVEAELNGHPLDWLETVGSVSVQRTRGIDGQQRLQNSPARLVQFRASAPVWRQRLIVSGAVRYVGSRLSAYVDRIPAVTLADLTVTAQRIHPRLDCQFGVRNLLNRQYSDPLSPEHTPHFLPGVGRNVYVRLIWRNE